MRVNSMNKSKTKSLPVLVMLPLVCGILW